MKKEKKRRKDQYGNRKKNLNEYKRKRTKFMLCNNTEKRGERKSRNKRKEASANIKNNCMNTIFY